MFRAIVRFVKFGSLLFREGNVVVVLGGFNPFQRVVETNRPSRTIPEILSVGFSMVFHKRPRRTTASMRPPSLIRTAQSACAKIVELFLEENLTRMRCRANAECWSQKSVLREKIFASRVKGWVTLFTDRCSAETRVRRGSARSKFTDKYFP